MQGDQCGDGGPEVSGLGSTALEPWFTGFNTVLFC